jgi:hypothetical protein
MLTWSLAAITNPTTYPPLREPQVTTKTRLVTDADGFTRVLRVIYGADGELQTSVLLASFRSYEKARDYALAAIEAGTK